ncbi:MAG: zinc transporter ZupT [Bacteroidales bacterium]|jgi:ZIP family zinc transporter|nr:zinc transporter ZupT [Bacteroidales bacterium]
MFEGNFIIALLLTLFAGMATGIGGAIIMFVKKFSPKYLCATLGFSAGVMILISLVELFQEAREVLSLEFGDKLGLLYTLLSFFGGMAIIALIDNFVPKENNPHEVNSMTIQVHEEAVGERKAILSFGEEAPAAGKGNSVPDNKSGKLLRLGILSSLVIAVHNFPEGLATFISAIENPELGASIAFAIALHNLPEGIAVAIPIYYATHKRGKAVGYATLSGIAEPLGGVLGYIVLRSILTPSLLACVLALVAGIMVYISLDELLPTAENYGEHHIAIIGVISGMVFMSFGLLLF